MTKKVAVIISTYGEVEHLTFKNLFHNSRRIIDIITSQIASLSKPMKFAIALFRSIKRKIHWGKAGYNSKLCTITRTQVSQIQAACQDRCKDIQDDVHIRILPAYYFISPYLEETLQSVIDYDYVLVVSMLPIESAFSCGVACKIAKEKFPPDKLKNLDIIGSLWNDEALITIYLNHIYDSLLKSDIAPDDPGLGLILSVHGTLIKDQNGQPLKLHTGLNETKAFYEKIKQAIYNDTRFNPKSVKLGCLNHHFGGEWTPESLQRAIQELKDENVQHAALFPYGFFADNSEIDLEAKHMLLEAGFEKAHYIGAVNDGKPFINWITERIARRIHRYLNIQKAIEKHSSEFTEHHT